MSTKTPPDFLQKLNHHKRDDHITFDEGPHIYTIDGDSGFTSVTTWVHSHFSHFDPDKVINNMFSSGKINDPTYKYFGMTKDQIKKQWSGGEAAQKGSLAATPSIAFLLPDDAFFTSAYLTLLLTLSWPDSRACRFEDKIVSFAHSTRSAFSGFDLHSSSSFDFLASTSS